MKLLFVCKANVGRSQVAMELYRRRGGDADSAGTQVDAPGETLDKRPGACTIVDIMRNDYSIDMLRNERTQLTQLGAAEYDTIVMIAQRDTIPSWALKDPRVVFWEIDDPKGASTDTTRVIVRQIESSVDALSLS